MSPTRAARAVTGAAVTVLAAPWTLTALAVERAGSGLLTNPDLLAYLDRTTPPYEDELAPADRAAA